MRDPALARVVAGALRFFDGQRYEMAMFAIMPNHVHALFRLVPPHRQEDVIKSWKGFSAREINRRLGRSGSLWQEDYWDRLIRNERHFAKVAGYIRGNPVKARLRKDEFIFYQAATEGGFSNPPAPAENPH